MTARLPKAIAFDVFGTVVDWRSGIVSASSAKLSEIGREDVSAEAFADGWRGRYIETMLAYRSSKHSFVPLDVLHLKMLDATLQSNGIDPKTLDSALIEDWNRAWHRLDPWHDSVLGLSRLKARFPIVALSNGNVALVLAMARHAGLPWDAILGAEFTRTYKPDPMAYLGTAQALAIAPAELCLVAAHHSDLAAARSCGLMTAYVDRPDEYGGRPAPDAGAEQAWDWSVRSITELAQQLGC